MDTHDPIAVVQSLSCVQLLATPWSMPGSLSFTISQSSLKLMSTGIGHAKLGDAIQPHLILCRSCILLPLIFPSIRVFSNELALHIMWPKCWSFSVSISSSNAYSGLISFRIDWFGLLVVQGTLQSLLQHHSLKASVLQCSAFFTVQLSHLYMTNGKKP